MKGDDSDGEIRSCIEISKYDLTQYNIIKKQEYLNTISAFLYGSRYRTIYVQMNKWLHATEMRF